MNDGRRHLAFWGTCSAVLIALALLSATALTGAANGSTTRLIGCVLAAASLLTGAACLGLALRGLIRSALTGVGARLQKQTTELNTAQEKRHIELMSRIASIEEQMQDVARGTGEGLRAIDVALDRSHAANYETSKVLSSLVRSHRLQTEQMNVIRKQTDAGAEGLDRVHALASATQAAAVAGRNSTRKLLNVVRGEAKRSREDLARLDSELRVVTGRLDDVEAGQRRTLNFLRREGSIQVVLDRLQASERRLLHSVEGGALTLAEEMSESGRQNKRELRDEIRLVVESTQSIRAGVERIQREVDASTTRTVELLATVGGVSQNIDVLKGSVGELGNESKAALGRLEESTSRTLDQMDGTLQDVSGVQEEVGAVAKSVLDSRNEAERQIRTLQLTLNGLQTQWDALEQSLQQKSVQQPTENATSAVRRAADSASEITNLVRITDALKNDVKSLHRHIDRTGVDTVRQTEALMQLLPRIGDVERRLPPSGGFAMAPDSLLMLADLIAEYKPRQILELGSGTSTIWIGFFAAAIGATVISVDHLEEYRARTQNALEVFGLEASVDLRLAELTPVEVMGEEKSWYDLNALQDLCSVDMVVVDGPPESTGPAPRSPAFPLVREMLSDRALLVVDDVHREQEAQMVEEWTDYSPGLDKTSWKAGRTAVLAYERERSETGNDSATER